MRYWHWSQRRSYLLHATISGGFRRVRGDSEERFFLSFSNFSVEVHPPVTLCAHSWTKCDASEVIWTCSLSEMRATEWSKCSRCQAGATTKPRAAQRRLRLHHHWLVSRTILIICRRVLRLSLVVARFPSCRLCGVLFCADLLVLSQLLSEWGLTHPAFGPLFPPRALDWRAFCWQPLTLPPGQRHLSWAVVDHLFAPGAQEGPSPRHWSYVAWAGPLCERTMYRGIPWEWNRKNLISNVFSSGGGRTNLFGWKPPADISTFVTDSA